MHLEKTILTEKMIMEDLSRVEESATKSTYRLEIVFERCEKKNNKSVPKFVLNSSYNKKEEVLKPTKIHYPYNSKSSFNPKRDVKRESPKPREEAFVCMFCGRTGHLDEFCFRRKRSERRRVEYARNSYRDEFIDFPHRSYSHVPPRFTLALRLTLLHVIFLSSLMDLVIAHMILVHERTALSLDAFGYGTRPHRGDRFPCRSGFSTGGFYTHFEPRHLDGPRFSRRGSCPTRLSGEVQRTIKTSSGLMVKC
jgi:hypothetical protein